MAACAICTYIHPSHTRTQTTTHHARIHAHSSAHAHTNSSIYIRIYTPTHAHTRVHITRHPMRQMETDISRTVDQVCTTDPHPIHPAPYTPHLSIPDSVNKRRTFRFRPAPTSVRPAQLCINSPPTTETINPPQSDDTKNITAFHKTPPTGDYMSFTIPKRCCFLIR